MNLLAGHGLGHLGDLLGAGFHFFLVGRLRGFLGSYRCGRHRLRFRVFARRQRPVGKPLQHDQLAARCEEGRFGGLQVV